MHIILYRYLFLSYLCIGSFIKLFRGVSLEACNERARLCVCVCCTCGRESNVASQHKQPCKRGELASHLDDGEAFVTFLQQEGRDCTDGVAFVLGMLIVQDVLGPCGGPHQSESIVGRAPIASILGGLSILTCKKQSLGLAAWVTHMSAGVSFLQHSGRKIGRSHSG